MKKWWMGLTVVLVLAAPGFGLGLGAELNAPLSGSNVGTGAAVTFKLDKIPYYFALGASGGANGVHVSATADNWLAEGRLVELLSWYAGLGAFADVNAGGGAGLNVGLRVPLGLNTYLLNKKLEIFLEVAPAVGVSFGPFQFPTLGLQNALGFRFWM